MVEFYLRPKNGSAAETTLIGFISMAAFLDFVREVEEVVIVAEKRKTEHMTILVGKRHGN